MRHECWCADRSPASPRRIDDDACCRATNNDRSHRTRSRRPIICPTSRLVQTNDRPAMRACLIRILALSRTSYDSAAMATAMTAVPAMRMPMTARMPVAMAVPTDFRGLHVCALRNAGGRTGAGQRHRLRSGSGHRKHCADGGNAQKLGNSHGSLLRSPESHAGRRAELTFVSLPWRGAGRSLGRAT